MISTENPLINKWESDCSGLDLRPFRAELSLVVGITLGSLATLPEAKGNKRSQLLKLDDSVETQVGER